MIFIVLAFSSVLEYIGMQRETVRTELPLHPIYSGTAGYNQIWPIPNWNNCDLGFLLFCL